MIVCWVLFLILTGVTLVGFVGYLHNANKAEAIVLAANAEIERKKELGVKPDNSWEFDPIIATPESDKAESQSKAFGELVYFSGVPAIVLLLWNIIWHTGHWVWQGRNKK